MTSTKQKQGREKEDKKTTNESLLNKDEGKEWLPRRIKEHGIRHITYGMCYSCQNV